MPVDLPSCGPMTASECNHHKKFQRKCENGEYLPLVGWIIGQGRSCESNGRVQQLREELQSLSS